MGREFESVASEIGVSERGRAELEGTKLGAPGKCAKVVGAASDAVAGAQDEDDPHIATSVPATRTARATKAVDQ